LSISSLADINTFVNNASNSHLWKSVAISSANTDTTMNLDSLNNGGYRLYTVDQAGNVSAKATNYVSIYTPGDTAIDLGSDGNLIAPLRDTTNAATATSGWVYHWDVNGDGIANDDKTMTSLNSLFSYDSNFQNASGDVDANHRFGTVGQVEVAMPLFGGQDSLFTSSGWSWMGGTVYTKTDLANIFSRFMSYAANIGAWVRDQGTSGSETWNWSNSYWSASEASNGENYYVFNVSLSRSASDTSVNNTALLVL
jgi:hypothetical protein